MSLTCAFGVVFASVLVAVTLGTSDCPTGPRGYKSCDGLGKGQYQYCYSCKQYLDCDGISSGVDLVDTPLDMVFDADLGVVWWSYTCSWVNGGSPINVNNNGDSNDWRDLTCITFDQYPDPFAASKGIYVKHTGVELEDDCGAPDEAGNCGYFPNGRAYMKMPYFSWNDFEKLTISLWFKRASSPSGFQTLVNKYPDGYCGDSSFDIASPNMDKVYIEFADVNGGKASNVIDSDYQDEWQHIAVTYSGSWDPTDTLTVKTYVNGVMKDRNMMLRGRLLRASGSVIVGLHICHDGNYFHGYIDSLSFSRKVLNDDQVAKLAADRSKCFV